MCMMRKRSSASRVRFGGSSALLTTLAFSLVLAAGAASRPTLVSSPSHQASGPIVGNWELYGGGVVQIRGSGSSFSGKIVEGPYNKTVNGNCDYAVGDVIYRITGKREPPAHYSFAQMVSMLYTGTLDWFRACKDNSNAGTRHREGTWVLITLNGETALEVCGITPGHTIGETTWWRSCDVLNRLSGSPPPEPKPTPPPPKPKPKPTPPPKPAEARGWLELSIALKPASAPSPLLRVCLKKSDSGPTLCFKFRKGDSLRVKNHGKLVEWPVGSRIRICVDAKAGWVTPPCQTVTIRRGHNEETLVSRQDTSPPEIRAFEYDGWAAPGEKVALQFGVKDDSGKAKIHNTVYQGGRRLGEAVTPLIAANGKRASWPATVDPSLVGPLYFCVWASDGAGNRSVTDNSGNEFEQYRSSCAWIPLVVPVARVSNTCGGEGWDAFVAVQHYFGNEHTYSDSNTNPLAKSYTVDFSAACNLHDAGYGGHAVIDTLNGNKPIDYRTWSRKQVDKKFLADLRRLCVMQIPAEARIARKNCQARGGNASFGAETLFNLVSKIGWNFFDADLTKPGLQKTGHRLNFH